MKQTEWQQRHTKLVEFAIRLCHLDLFQLREGALLDLKQDLVNFLDESGLKLGGLKPDDFTNKLVLDIQRSFQEQLSMLAVRNEDSGKELLDLFVMTEKLPAKVSLFGADLDEPFYLNSVVEGGIKERILEKLFQYISRSGFRRDRLRICSRKTCQRVFLSKKAPRDNANLHCSIICSRQDATERYRAKQRDKAKAKYRKKIATKWPKTPVGRAKTQRRS